MKLLNGALSESGAKVDPSFYICSHAGMGTKHFDSLTALIRAGLQLRVECSCNRVVLLDPIRLLQQSLEAGGDHQLDKVVARMRCGACGARPIRFGPA